MSAILIEGYIERNGRGEVARHEQQLTRVQPLAPPGVGVPDEHVGRLVGDDGEEVAVLVPAEADAHARQPHLLHHLGVPVVDVDALVVPRRGQVATRRPLPREEDAARAVGRLQREQLLPRRPHVAAAAAVTAMLSLIVAAAAVEEEEEAEKAERNLSGAAFPRTCRPRRARRPRRLPSERPPCLVRRRKAHRPFPSCPSSHSTSNSNPVPLSPPPPSAPHF